MIPCWELIGCSADKREACPAFQDNSRPCWMLKGLECTPSHGNECGQCVVYRFGSLYTEQIKSVVYDQSGSLAVSAVISGLMGNKERS
jgi:hypothetical protein